jgi:hypothetical protein
MGLVSQVNCTAAGKVAIVTKGNDAQARVLRWHKDGLLAVLCAILVNLADASPERSVVGSRVPIFLIHGSADDNIPPWKSEQIRDRNPAEIGLWKVPKPVTAVR